MILELGLRFRPQTTDNQEEYAATVTFLAQDVSDVPPHLLQQAINEWVRTKRFLPRASELIEMAQEAQRSGERGTDAALRQLEAHCDGLNAMPWVKASGKPYMISERTVDGKMLRFVDRAA